MELFKASRQWSSRPADERFWNVAELHQACNHYKASSKETVRAYGNLVAIPDGSEVLLSDRSCSTQPARLTHWAFGQLSARAEAPAAYLRTIPAALASECINHGLALRVRDGVSEQAQIMGHQNGDFLIRSITSNRYDRIWNADVTSRLMQLADRGWVNPPAYATGRDDRAREATEDDVKRLNGASIIRVGDRISPAGLYASDRDMFAFLIDPSRPINDGSDQGMYRGFFCWNSEVGSASFGLTTFLFRVVCGNHIIWSAQDVKTIKVRHVGDAAGRAFGEMVATVEHYADSSATDEEALIAKARTYRLGKDKDAVLDLLFNLRLPVSRARIEEALENANENAHENDPYSVYGFVNGLTRISQAIPYANERTDLDRAAGTVMRLVGGF